MTRPDDLAELIEGPGPEWSRELADAIPPAPAPERRRRKSSGARTLTLTICAAGQGTQAHSGMPVVCGLPLGHVGPHSDIEYPLIWNGDKRNA